MTANLQQALNHIVETRGSGTLSPTDLDARWRTHNHSEPTRLCYLENAIVDKSGFIIARSATRASEADWKLIPKLSEELPTGTESLAADSSYSVG